MRLSCRSSIHGLAANVLGPRSQVAHLYLTDGSRLAALVGVLMATEMQPLWAGGGDGSVARHLAARQAEERGAVGGGALGGSDIGPSRAQSGGRGPEPAPEPSAPPPAAKPRGFGGAARSRGSRDR